MEKKKFTISRFDEYYERAYDVREVEGTFEQAVAACKMFAVEFYHTHKFYANQQVSIFTIDGVPEGEEKPRELYACTPWIEGDLWHTYDKIEYLDVER